MNTKKINGILALCVLLFLGAMSCKTPQQKHDCLLNTYGDHLCTIDTITIRDTVVKTIKVPVPEYKDSFIFKHDTTYETKEVIVYKKGDKIFLTVKPKEIIVRDTVAFEVKVPGQVIRKEYFNWWYLVVAFLVGMIITRHRYR
jgi:arginine deiminase